MIYLQVILTIFSILLLTTIILGVIWWKKYGKTLFSLIKPNLIDDIYFCISGFIIYIFNYSS